MTIQTRAYRVRFLTPAFLGNAEQNGQWRTPPFKHLLREWWRVAWASENNPDEWKHMREQEGLLFGHAWLKDDKDSRGKRVAARKSLVRLRLGTWANGRMKNLPSTPRIGEGRNTIPSGLYLGYGPVRSATELKMQHPIDAGEESCLEIAYPANQEGVKWIDSALALVHWYGTLGGRNRNGWGSILIEPEDGTPPLVDGLKAFQRDWRQALAHEWSNAVGIDQSGALIWRTASRDRWEDVVGDLGRIRKRVNNEFKGERRKILNQPVKGRGARVPSSLRFKVRRSGDGGLYGVVLHMPCTPGVIQNNRAVITEVWQRVHGLLDSEPALERIAQ